MTAQDAAQNAELQEEFLKPEPKLNGIQMRPVNYGHKDLLRQAVKFLPSLPPPSVPQENESKEAAAAREICEREQRTEVGLLYLHFFLYIQGGPIAEVLEAIDDERTFRHAAARFMLDWSEEEALKGAKWQTRMFRMEHLTQFEIAPRKDKKSDSKESPPPNS